MAGLIGLSQLAVISANLTVAAIGVGAGALFIGPILSPFFPVSVPKIAIILTIILLIVFIALIADGNARIKKLCDTSADKVQKFTVEPRSINKQKILTDFSNSTDDLLEYSNFVQHPYRIPPSASSQWNNVMLDII